MSANQQYYASIKYECISCGSDTDCVLINNLFICGVCGVEASTAKISSRIPEDILIEFDSILLHNNIHSAKKYTQIDCKKCNIKFMETIEHFGYKGYKFIRIMNFPDNKSATNHLIIDEKVESEIAGQCLCCWKADHTVQV